MSEETELNEIYRIDKERLVDFYERIRKGYEELSEKQKASKFLISQSIGSSEEQIQKILTFFEERNYLGLEMQDFIFEWVRAQKIRLEYKRYLILQEYPGESLELAIDDSLSTFFVEYDSYLKKFIKKTFPEYILAILYNIFFYDYENDGFDFSTILNEMERKLPSDLIPHENKIPILTLRIGLSNVISEDYTRILQSRTEKHIKKGIFEREEKEDDQENEFSFSLLEKILKTYFIKKSKPLEKEIEKASVQLLNAYFKFGQIFIYNDFEDKLINFLAENLYDCFTSPFKSLHSQEKLKILIINRLKEIKEQSRDKKMDGVAWVNDLKPVINRIMIVVFDKLLDFKKLKEEKIEGIAGEQLSESDIKSIKEKVEALHPLDEKELFTLNLDLEKFRVFLETTLEETDVGLIQKRNYLRQQVDLYRALLRKKGF